MTSSIATEHVAVEIFTPNGIIRGATIPCIVNNISYEPTVISFNKNPMSVDVSSQTVSIQEFDIVMSYKRSSDESISFYGNRVRIIVLRSDKNIITTLGSFAASKKPQKFEVAYYIESRIKFPEFDRQVGSFSFKISLSNNFTVSDKAQNFTKDLFGRYFIFKGIVSGVEDYIVVPDISPAGALPLGRFVAFNNMYDSMIQPVVLPKSFRMSEYNINSLGTGNNWLSVLWADYVTYREKQSEYFDKFIPLHMRLAASRRYSRTISFVRPTEVRVYGDGDPISAADYRDINRLRRGQRIYYYWVTEYTNETVTREGIENFYSFDSLEDPLGFDSVDLGSLGTGANFGYIFLVRVPAENKGVYNTTTSRYDPNHAESLASITSSWKAARYAFKYHGAIERIDGKDYERILTNQQLPNLYYSSMNIRVSSPIDLRDAYNSNRLLSFEFTQGVDTDGNVNYSSTDYRSISMPVAPYFLKQKQIKEFLDPTVLSHSVEGKDGCIISPMKWFAMAVPGLRYVKSITVPQSIFNGVPKNALLNSRLDVLNLSTAGEFMSRFKLPDESVNSSSFQHDTIFESATGELAYVESVNHKADFDREGELTMTINFYQPNQAIRGLNEGSIPNRLVKFSSERVEDKVFLMSYRSPPENVPEEGQMIPIVYGYVEKFPMIQAISKKYSYANLGLAGDDIYIICSHPISRRDHNSVQIWWGLDEIANGSDPMLSIQTQINTEENAHDYARNFVIPNPFPAYESMIKTGILTIDTGVDDIGAIELKHRYYAGESNPFHYLVEVEDNFSGVHTGVRLRGDEYKGGGNEDPRFLIRNGLGSSKLYASFVGKPDDAIGTITGNPNGVITHPAHIIMSLLIDIGEVRKQDIDMNSFAKAYSSDPEMRLGVYITDNSTLLADLFTEISTHSFLFHYINNGKHCIASISFEDSKNPVAKFSIDSDGLRIINVNSSAYYLEYTGVDVRYGYYFPTGEFSKTISFNKDNNSKCRTSFRRSQENNVASIDLKYCFDDSMAYKIASRYVDLYTQIRTSVTLVVPMDKTTSNIKIGDVISITASKMLNYASNSVGLNAERFVVISVLSGGAGSDSAGQMTLEALQIAGG